MRVVKKIVILILSISCSLLTAQNNVVSSFLSNSQVLRENKAKLDSLNSKMIWIDSVKYYRALCVDKGWKWEGDFTDYCNVKPKKEFKFWQKINFFLNGVERSKNKYEYCAPLNSKIGNKYSPDGYLFNFKILLPDKIDTLGLAYLSIDISSSGREIYNHVGGLPGSGQFNFINPFDRLKALDSSLNEKQLIPVLINSTQEDRFSNQLLSFFPTVIEHYYYFIYSVNGMNSEQKFWILDAETGLLIQKGKGIFKIIEKKNKKLFLETNIHEPIVTKGIRKVLPH
jgi:hypothetical protein